MIAIVDYGVGNLFSLTRSFHAIGQEVTVTAEEQVLRQADKLVLPGVGAFPDAAQKLRQTGLDRVVVEQAQAGKPLLGICLGMQLLFDRSLEYGCHPGLGLIPGEVVPMAGKLPEELKIPHMGWNALDICRATPLFSNIKDKEYVYFVHSFYASQCEPWVVATASYGLPLTAAVQKDNVYGCQFHPEKSGQTGLNILRGFAQL